MQIHAISINHFLSFDTFVWEGLDPHLNVIVGPNGAGKTNLFRALQAVRDALSPTRAEAAARWANAGHQGADADAITIALDIQFTTALEQRILCAFFASVLCDQKEIQEMATATGRGMDANALRRFAAWVQEQVRPRDIAWFLHGRLVMTHAGRSGWQCRYEARPGEPRFRLDLTSWGTLVGHAEHSQDAGMQNWGSLFDVWCNSLTEQEREQLKNGLTGSTPEVDFPVPDLSHLPDWVSSQQGVALQMEDTMQIVDPTTLATRRAFTAAAQLSPEPARPIGISFIFQCFLDRALVFTDNVRLPPQRTFAARDLHTEPFDMSNGEDLARFLYRKKNGGHHDSNQYAAIQDLFLRMTGRRFDVVSGPAGSRETQSDISLELVTRNAWGNIRLEFSGAGIAEALFLSAVLAGSSGQVVLLDEPALNLHPTMQTTLLDALQTLAHRPEGEGSQFLVNTHAPNLVPPDAIDRVSRFTWHDGHTVRRALDVREMSRDDLSDFRQLLRGNLTARALLFGRAVLLLEGETELATLPVWCPDLERQNIALYVAGGATHFVRPLKFIQHFGIPWAIIGDGEALWDLRQRRRPSGPQHNIRTILATCNQAVPPIPGDPGENVQDFARWRKSLEALGIFTLASSANEGFENALQPDIPPDRWELAKTLFGSNKVACGRFIAENCPCPIRVAELITRVLCYLSNAQSSYA